MCRYVDFELLEAWERGNKLGAEPALEYAVHGQYRRTEDDTNGMEQGDDVFFLVNSTELRMVGFQMDPVDPPPTPSAHVSHRTRRASSAPERASTEGRRFRLPADVENQGLALCW